MRLPLIPTEEPEHVPVALGSSRPFESNDRSKSPIYLRGNRPLAPVLADQLRHVVPWLLRKPWAYQAAISPMAQTITTVERAARFYRIERRGSALGLDRIPPLLAPSAPSKKGRDLHRDPLKLCGICAECLLSLSSSTTSVLAAHRFLASFLFLHDQLSD